MSEPDTLNEAGANRLAKKIRAYWRAKGFAPYVTVKPSETQHQMWVIRSDMINGAPTEASRILTEAAA